MISQAQTRAGRPVFELLQRPHPHSRAHKCLRALLHTIGWPLAQRWLGAAQRTGSRVSHRLVSSDWAEPLTVPPYRGLPDPGRAEQPSRAPQRARIGGALIGGPRAAGREYSQAFGKTPVQEVEAHLAVWQGNALERRKVKFSLRWQMDEGRTAGMEYHLPAETS